MEIWDYYFATIVGWSLHPGYSKEGSKKMDLIECAAMADEMVVISEACSDVEDWTKFKVYGPDGKLKECV